MAYPITATHADLISRGWLMSHGVRIGIILAAVAGITLAGRVAVARARRRLAESIEETGATVRQRTATIATVASSAARVLMYGVAVLLVLDQLGINLAPLLAGAGILGIALGFGAQTLVRDFLAGFFMLAENQLAVGNMVDVRASGTVVTGVVEGLSVRTTSIRTFDGTLHVIPNGSIEMVGNRSRGWARAIVDIRVAYGSDVEAIEQTLHALFEEMQADPGSIKGAFSRPTLLGVETIGTAELVFRVVSETRPSHRWDVERELRARIVQALEANGIKGPMQGRFVVPFPTNPGATG